jgi:hypothetical protein
MFHLAASVKPRPEVAEDDLFFGVVEEGQGIARAS